LARVRSGRFVGDVALFLDVPYLSSARAATYAEIHWFERTRLLAVMEERPPVALGWLVSAMATIADTHEHLEMVLGRTAREQVAGALIGNMDDRGRVEISQSALGALLGVGRQTINRALAELAELGMVRTGYRTIEVLDAVALANLFDGVDLPTH
jgi:CRP-like cAMP-binding protein